MKKLEIYQGDMTGVSVLFLNKNQIIGQVQLYKSYDCTVAVYICEDGITPDEAPCPSVIDSSIVVDKKNSVFVTENDQHGDIENGVYLGTGVWHVSISRQRKTVHITRFSDLGESPLGKF